MTPQILNVRGGHGSGKTTLVRRVMEAYESSPGGSKLPGRVEGRGRPLYYHLQADGMRMLMVVGSYETPTGGCDTVGSIDLIVQTVRTGAMLGYAVLFEGIVAQHSSGRLIELSREFATEVVVLTTSCDECVASVRARREARGADVENFDPRNVVKEWKSVASSTRRIRGECREPINGSPSGLAVLELDREAGYQHVLGRLRTTTGRTDQTNPDQLDQEAT